jgi:hypothetical protein
MALRLEPTANMEHNLRCENDMFAQCSTFCAIENGICTLARLMRVHAGLKLKGDFQPQRRTQARLRTPTGLSWLKMLQPSSAPQLEHSSPAAGELETGHTTCCARHAYLGGCGR